MDLATCCPDGNGGAGRRAAAPDGNACLGQSELLLPMRMVVQAQRAWQWTLASTVGDWGRNWEVNICGGGVVFCVPIANLLGRLTGAVWSIIFFVFPKIRF
jgi:hypothetical protein